MRATVYQYLTAQTALTALVPVARWYQAGAVVDTPKKPFVVLRWLAPVQANTPTRFLKQLRVDVHDQRGSYKNIDAFLGSPDRGDGVYGALSGLAQLVGVDGRITQAEYLGHSGDQEDPVYMTNFKFSSWRMIGVDL
jgi:hypothetical protein